MRIILVGSPRNRARLRRELDASVEIAAAAILLAEHGHHDAPDDDGIEQPLTRREMEVLQLLAEGLPNKSVAERLGISDQTVKFHVASISSKLGASNRTDAVRLGLRRGLITLRWRFVLATTGC